MKEAYRASGLRCLWQAQATDASYALDDDKTSKRSESSSSSPVKGNVERSYDDGILNSPVITPRGLNGPNASLRKALSHSALPAAYLSERQGRFSAGFMTKYMFYLYMHL